MDNKKFENILYRYFRGQLHEEEYEVLATCLREESFRIQFEQAKQEWSRQPELDDTGRMNWVRLQFRDRQYGYS
jgi:hypothetical protein